MPNSLPKELRNQLAKTTLLARDLAEKAARAALQNLAVHEKDYRPHMTHDQRLLRNRLRARGRALGDRRDEKSGIQEIGRLTELVAYENWHRLLFTRFLTENNLLIADEKYGSVPVTLEDCEELASEAGAADGFELACRFASQELPGVFRKDDAALEVVLAPNDRVGLKKLLDSLPSEIFKADDSLGWTYQFWQAKRKEAVNESGVKIGADELSPVTQLFTEDYMVEFLLHNTIGAWWAGKRGMIKAATEADARAQIALSAKNGLAAIDWTYLRFVQDETSQSWKPAAGTFGGWPKTAKEIKFLDPCMGSGHFLVFALPILARLRMEEEGLSVAQAVVAALRDNIHGLELDERCTQIAAFNLALTAWKLAGYQALPSLHLACSGLAPYVTEKDWVGLAGDNEKLKNGMKRLHELFEQAPVLGSLIDPCAGEDDLLVAAFHELKPLLEKALAKEAKDDTAHEMAVTAHGLTKAAEILADQFTLTATNVPYLGRGKQNDGLKNYCERMYPEAKADLATCFVDRCINFCSKNGSAALVTPQNWLFLGSYKEFRWKLLKSTSIESVMRLGSGAFETIGGEVVNAALISISRRKPASEQLFFGVDVANASQTSEKASALSVASCRMALQSAQCDNPGAVISVENIASQELLEKYAPGLQGIASGDNAHFRRGFWEVPRLTREWSPLQSTPDSTAQWRGREHIIFWENGSGAMATSSNSRIQGNKGWGKVGVAVNRVQNLYVTVYTGEMFDDATNVIPLSNPNILLPLWCFTSSPDYKEAVRRLNQKVSVANSAFVQVPFNLEYWQKVAADQYPHGPPKPFSADPTQWLFNGHPAGADQPLQVAVARLLGYQWPRQTGSSFLDCPALSPDSLEKFVDDDGIICLQALNREQPAAQRLRALLAESFGKEWSGAKERDLLAAAGSDKSTLDEWLRDDFFEQHCDIFHNRPFIWHIWDGRKDGFHALINYHKLNHSNLQKLTYSYLGDWIRQQKEDTKADKAGAAERLGAAEALQKELIKILEGEAPYDIFVRWKPLKEQPIGWHPDLNDGVRLNIRPFVMAREVAKKGAGILRAKPKGIKWDKDRGKEPQRDKKDHPWFWCDEEPGTDPTGGKSFAGHRWNDVHLTIGFKRAAQADKGIKK